MTALDPLMAGFAAGASAFIVYAMPAAQFEAAVALSGLPMVLPAAAPPLGMTARFGVMAAAAIASFALVFLILRALGKPAPRPKRRAGPVEIEMTPPKLRRADAHPDAPSRRPILAGVDLGRSFDDVPSAGESEKIADSAFDEVLDPAPEGDEADTTPGRAASEPEPSDLLADSLSGIGFRHAADEDEEPAFEPLFSDFETSHPNEPQQAAAEVAPIETSEDDTEENENFQPSDAERAAPERETIPELMARLEAGLRRRQPETWPTAAARQVSRSEAPTEIDQRLRGAIEELQKLAGHAN